MNKPPLSQRLVSKRAATCLACSLFLIHPAIADPLKERPNIILFLVDDLGLMDTSVPMLADAGGKPQGHPLNEWYRTPNLEKLAENGTRFSHFYAHSVCSPSRVSIMTGQNSARHTTTQWIDSRGKNTGDFGPPEWNWEGLKGDDITLPRLFQAAGYRTIHVGKAHFGPRGKPGADPVNLGFDVNIAGTAAGQPRNYLPNRGYGVPHLDKYKGTDTYLTEALTLEASAQMEAAVAEGKPFFLHLSHYAVHAPFQADPRFIDNYGEEKSKPARIYASMVEGVDKSLGDIMAKVESLGLADQTLLIFFGDNGSDAPLGKDHAHGSSAPLRGKKATHFEGGTRVPFVASWVKPDAGNIMQKKLPIQAGQIQTQMGTILDLMPTLSNLAGVKIPDGHAIDGIDLRAQLGGAANPDRPNFFINHFPHRHRSSYYTSHVQGDWKLIYFYPVNNKARHALFNLVDDPYEKNNLAESNPEQMSAMIASLRREMEKYGALYPVKDGAELRLPGDSD